MQNVIFDISEYITTRKSAPQSIQDWQDIFNAVTDMITIHDSNYNIVYANPAAQKNLNLPSLDVPAKCYKYYHGMDKPPAGCPSCKSLNTGRVAKTEIFEPYLDKNIEIRAIPRTNVNKQVVGLIHIVRDISERKKREDQLRESNKKLTNLAAHLQSVREEERKRIAREIHDELAQELTALKMDMLWIDSKYLRNHKLISQKVRAVSDSIDSTIASVQRIISELRPGLLDNLSLEEAMTWQAEEFQSRSGVQCDIKFHAKQIKMHQDMSTAVFRIFQETLTNVARHSSASKVFVDLNERQGKAVLIMRDNGRGITDDEMNNPSSFGLIGMKERAEYFKGSFTIDSSLNKGTTVKVSIPVFD